LLTDSSPWPGQVESRDVVYDLLSSSACRRT
jgi:hypothetical protein